MLIIDWVIIGNLFVSSKKYHRYHFTEHLHKVLLVTNTYRKSKDFSSTAVEYLVFFVQSDQQETKSRVLPHLLFYRNVFLSWISRFYLLAVDTRFVGCLPLKNLSLIVFINFL
jgi:hypothetical protein